MVEMLAALAVLALLTAVVAMGVTAGVGIYRQSLFGSESEEVSGLIDSSLSNPLRYATYSQDASNVITYSIVYRDDAKNCRIVDTNPRLVDQDGMLYLENSDASVSIPLLNAGAYADCRVSGAHMECTPAEIIGGYTVSSKEDASLSRDFSFDYRLIYPEAGRS